MSLTGLLTSTEKMVPEGRLHMRPFQFQSLDFGHPPSLVSDLFSSPRVVAKSHKRYEGRRPSHLDHSI